MYGTKLLSIQVALLNAVIFLKGKITKVDGALLGRLNRLFREVFQSGQLKTAYDSWTSFLMKYVEHDHTVLLLAGAGHL